MYKKASKFQQRLRFSLADIMGEGFETLTPLQQRENLVKKVEYLRAECAITKNREYKAELGQKIFTVQTEINAIRPKLKGKPETRDHFIDVAKEVLPKYLFKEIMDKASARANSNVISISPHPIVTQPETNLPISGLGGYDQVLRDEFEDGKK
jgi:hypothetical protein